MKNIALFFIYLAIMAGVTYLVRMLPLVLCKKKIQNRFVQSFLYYIPYAVLGAMTFPAIFSATGNTASSVAGTIVACVLGWYKKSLLVVAACASLVALLAELALNFFA